MKRIVLRLLPLMMALMLVACSERYEDKVVSTYRNGQPAKVQTFDSKGECVHEINYYEDGAVWMEGDMKGQLREGDWKSYFPDGKVQSTGTFKDGLRVGKAVIYFENGNINMEGYYDNGDRVGDWTYYDEQGYNLGVTNFDK
ncbi:MAG: hypothetical protein K6A28_04590 [Bacteroidales bacterium]|nr:hypothetical protein [Bacteroidales bacterium]